MSLPPAVSGHDVAGLLFDMDGTLIDSMQLHDRSWALWHAEIGLPFDEDGFFQATAGRTNQEILADMLPGRSVSERDALAERKEVLYREIAERELQLIPGVDEVLAQARERGLKLAICTAAPPANIEVAARRFGLAARFDAVVCPADGLRGKPHPDIFLEAARRLGLAATQCLVYEDAPLGIEAARRAGMPAVALTTTLDADAFGAFPNVIATAADFVGHRIPDSLPIVQKEKPHA
ncbi:HAD superfamily hydrolase (TIGR01509 family) [Sphaerotilus hippei]|uniref:HAD superfamily hydrolase (TIGR01509 family) n=1 Tax=Sphaerotilus hippei TaxID=744406 RepID=A0A318GZB5_9BURK|nr:HAD family phosphatase [Sphaerotilus hippei]PXW94988.1 HAD superfamily hydrolase (TIGR01509 family) [Sphaerotilus hippei]